ncbi:hypothetical protein AAC387_Pa03g3951 [Persea americana]
MEDAGSESPCLASATTALVSLPNSAAHSPSPRRLSTNFRSHRCPVPASRRLSWHSLQGRLVGAAEATSARAIGGDLSGEQSVAWELFSPIHRVLIVSVVASAAADLRKTRQIFQLQRSVELRDQVLSSMQQKLDSLCEQMNFMKDQVETVTFLEKEDKNMDSVATGLLSCQSQICKSNDKSVLGGSWNSSVDLKDVAEKDSGQDEIFKMPDINNAEQEERRMSDLSDWCSSVTSSVEIQLNTLATEQDIYNLHKELEDKDITIKELATIAHASDIASSKRISDLEDTIRRKNMIITKLKKDMVVLEQKVMHLTRLRRPSFSASNSNNTKLPAMANNVLYDMDSSTSPSSSDSDCPVERGQHQPEDLFSDKDENDAHQDDRDENVPHQDDIASRKTQVPSLVKANISLSRSTYGHPQQRPLSPLKENSMNQRAGSTMALRPQQLVSTIGEKKNRRRFQSGSKDATPQKRWV